LTIGSAEALYHIRDRWARHLFGPGRPQSVQHPSDKPRSERRGSLFLLHEDFLRVVVMDIAHNPAETRFSKVIDMAVGRLPLLFSSDGVKLAFIGHGD
jgi:hypothetical protein